MTSAAQSVVLVRDGQIVPCSLEAGAWLAQSPRGESPNPRVHMYVWQGLSNTLGLQRAKLLRQVEDTLKPA